MMKLIKRGMTMLMAILLIMPALLTRAEETVVLENGVPDEVWFNTGNHAWRIGTENALGDDMADGYFETDGSYTINLPETNPFFPYEVQFTYDGQIIDEWFMTPDDSVEIGGHIFYVSAYFDDTAVTQMSLNVAGDTVIVYPEKKEFTTDGDGTAVMSLLPLEEIYISADLSAYTPIELTMVSIDSIFMGENALADTDSVVWTYSSGNNFKISASGDNLDLSYGTTSTSATWQMIVGQADQLEADNIRYMVNLSLGGSRNWLTPTVYTQDSTGKRTEISVADSYYSDYYSSGENGRELYVRVPECEIGNANQAYVGLSINKDVFGSTQLDHLKVYEGKFDTAEEAAMGKDITDRLLNQDMTQKDAGYILTRYNDQWVTVVSYDSENRITGCLPFYLYMSVSGNYISVDLFKRTESGRNYVVSDYSYSYADNYVEQIFTLYHGYVADAEYTLTMDYKKAGNYSPSDVTAAYIGLYDTVASAVASGAKDIKNSLCGSDYATEGYTADYSKGIYFTVFVGEDGEEDQEIYRYYIRTEEGTVPVSTLSSGTGVWFYGLRKSDGTEVPSYVVGDHEDSYADYSYLTILVGEDTDLTELAPVFSTSDGVNLYAEDSKSPEVSGDTMHDFSNGAVHYSVSAENGTDSKNYWLQVVKAVKGAGQLYINSLADENAKTTEKDNTVYSTREILLDGYHGYVHDIWLANIGTDAIPSLSVELASDVVELDSYWTLSGNNELSGFTTVNKTTSYGELPNLAKIRIREKEGVESGTDVSGTLTVRSGNKDLIVLTLTGTVGNPCITTSEIPEAVKYVPYGTMIQNNNKYSWNKVSYYLTGGSLPKGMEVKQNGELYGVPAEAGEFTFTVYMTNSYSSFSYSIKTYTLVVAENTDENVEAATDIGYELKERLQNIYLDTLGDGSGQLVVSQGEYDEFVELYLDGEALVKGEDYVSEAGSTRITIRNQTLADQDEGSHTLSMEFRAQDTDELKRAAQNFTIASRDSVDTGNGNMAGNGTVIVEQGKDTETAGKAPQSATEKNGSATVIWKIVDAAGQPYKNITVELHSTPMTAVTDQRGIVVFRDVKEGWHTLTVKDQNNTVLASKNFELLFGDAFRVEGDRITVKMGSAFTVLAQTDNGSLALISMREGDLYHVASPRTDDPAAFGETALIVLLAGIGATLYTYGKRRRNRTCLSHKG